MLIQNECLKEIAIYKYTQLGPNICKKDKETDSIIGHLFHCTNGALNIISLPISINNLQTITYKAQKSFDGT